MKPAPFEFENMASQAYTCAAHGSYTAPQLPPGVSHWCPACSMQLQTETAAVRQLLCDDAHRFQLWNASDLPRRYRNRTLDNWNTTNERQRKTLELVKRWASDIASRLNSGKGLLLYGPPGVGKTHLLAALVTEACRAGVGARYAVWSDALERTKATFNAQGEHPDRDLLDRLAVVPVLVLDELGGDASTFDAKRLFELVDARYREALPVLAGTNLTLSKLGSLGERTADRLREMCIAVPMDGQSQRGRHGIGDDADPAMHEPGARRVRMRVTVNGQEREEVRMVDVDGSVRSPQ